MVNLVRGRRYLPEPVRHRPRYTGEGIRQKSDLFYDFVHFISISSLRS